MATHTPADRWATGAAGLLLLVALAFGGGLKGGGDALVHAMGVLALGVALTRWRWRRLGRTQQVMAWCLAFAVGLALLQLIPLPIGWYERLPERADIVADLHGAGLYPHWLSMTLDHWATLRALLSVTTFAAMWMLCTSLPMELRIRLLKLAVVAAIPLALLGFAQSSMKLDTTGANAMFANRNHFASLMAMLLPLAFVAARESRSRQLPGGAVLWLATTVILLLAAALSFSRTGFLLACLASLAALLSQANRRSLNPSGSTGALAALAVAAIAVGYFAFDRLDARFASDISTDLRWTLLSRGLPLLQAWLPWGSGLGTFGPVYGMTEPLQSLGQYVAAPYAHDELLQVGIEAGWPGLLLAGTFVGSIAVAVAGAFRRHSPAGDWRRAAAISAVVPLVHSLVDYPLRTFACSLLLALLLSVCPQPPSRTMPARGETP
ncbi:hypothetical protein BH11PSE14_BH11PSE14_02810 [soil metagenome]